jgi:sugar lactone lactonase YvrE
MKWKLGVTHGEVVAGDKVMGRLLHQLNSPTDVIVDYESDSMIICDRGNKRVVRWPRQNNTTSGEIIISNIGCVGLTMDDRRFLYVADYEQHYVKRWKLGKNVEDERIVAGGYGLGGLIDQLSYPTFVFVDRNYSLYVSDSQNVRVVKWIEGALEGIVVAGGQGRGTGFTQLGSAQGIVVDRWGTVYVADETSHRIMRWPKGATQGSVILNGNTNPRQSNHLYNPVGFSFDRHGNLYVAERSQGRVQRFQLESSELLVRMKVQALL